MNDYTQQMFRHVRHFLTEHPGSTKMAIGQHLAKIHMFACNSWEKSCLARRTTALNEVLDSGAFENRGTERSHVWHIKGD